MSPIALIFVARYPHPGHVKTRLARDLGHDFATTFYRACAENSFAAAVALRGNVPCGR